MIVNLTLMYHVLEHVRGAHPIEACGILAGPPGSQPTRHIPMTNTEASPDAFAFDPAEQLAVFADLDQHGEDPLIYYHSHTRGRAYPSQADIAYAADPEAYHLIISTQDPDQPSIRGFRIVNGHVVEEPVNVA